MPRLNWRPQVIPPLQNLTPKKKTQEQLPIGFHGHGINFTWHDHKKNQPCHVDKIYHDPWILWVRVPPAQKQCIIKLRPSILSMLGETSSNIYFFAGDSWRFPVWRPIFRGENWMTHTDQQSKLYLGLFSHQFQIHMPITCSIQHVSCTFNSK